MQSMSVSKRRSRALQAYAVLCGLTGLSGLLLTLWAHPQETADRLAQAAVRYDAQSQLAQTTPENRHYLRGVARDLKQQAAGYLPVEAPAASEFRGVTLSADAL